MIEYTDPRLKLGARVITPHGPGEVIKFENWDHSSPPTPNTPTLPNLVYSDTPPKQEYNVFRVVIELDEPNDWTSSDPRTEEARPFYHKYHGYYAELEFEQ